MGPYLSERPWGTVREDDSAHGNAWDYVSRDQARSRAYRWGEDGGPASPRRRFFWLVASPRPCGDWRRAHDPDVEEAPRD
jgi:hypothetical protein